MPLVAVSKDNIRANLILHFHKVFKDPIDWFKGGTNVRRLYYKSKPEAWRRLAILLSKLSWMVALNVVIEPDEMIPLKTIDDLTDNIWGKLNQVVAVPASVGRLRAHKIRLIQAPKGAAVKKARSKRKRGPGSRKMTAKRPKQSRR